jgi:hypothetical protein
MGKRLTDGGRGIGLTSRSWPVSPAATPCRNRQDPLTEGAGARRGRRGGGAVSIGRFGGCGTGGSLNPGPLHDPAPHGEPAV